MNHESLELKHKTPACSLYQLPATPDTKLSRFISSTPQTRAICNDPIICGVEYTDLLREACSATLEALASEKLFSMQEMETIVFHVLRGGLNFGLREALATAHGWNRHGSAFISAQRARDSKDSEDWHITESAYKKVYLPKIATAVLGDVVATGTSLEHALQELLKAVDQQGAQLKSILFFTIGGERSEEIIREIDAICMQRYEEYEGSAVIYVEGRFEVAQIDTQLSIRLTGTDLLRRGSLMAPEFIESQYANPAYPIERCTIYDAGSRAFWLPEYFADIHNYWLQCLSLAESGMSFSELLKERFPELDVSRFSSTNLKEICRMQIEAIEKIKD